MKKRHFYFIGIAIAALYLWAVNSDVLAIHSTKRALILAHRGVHQNFELASIENQSCTANQIHTPTHKYLENTLPSIRAAFGFGADIVELDVHPTTDGSFAVFHDWTLDCRTNGSGRVRDHDIAYLKKLDIGYGYTADGGASFPFRGTFIGGMPMLDEVLTEFPTRRFLINIKSRSAEEARQLIAYLARHNIAESRIIIYGDQTPIDAIRTQNPNILTMGKQQSKACFKSYVLLGWTNYLPKSCRNTWVPVPENYTQFLWGWPNRFENRLQKAGSSAVLMGPHTKARAEPAIDTLEQLKSIPESFEGIIWTNRIEIIGPAARP